MRTELWWERLFEKGNFDDQAIAGNVTPGKKRDRTLLREVDNPGLLSRTVEATLTL